MYKNFFGFKERPFKLVPNPAYLFLSKSHEEALAHLTYAVIQGEGFMEITGEVGTGKTTLCRAFLEHLDDNTKAAYIFNPNLNSLELLRTINDEFGIKSDTGNTKSLVDALNSFLIEKKTEGKNIILLIDEAQNLSKDVLEQLRLLSNLETSRHKLLYIILVGQPELKEKLNSHELRQLGQRISLSCRLIPLSHKEVTGYIQHRINIASEKSGIQFTRNAYRLIYKYSQGIPRLINIACDRALLTAFGLDQQNITGKIVRTAIRELTTRGEIERHSIWERKKAILFFFIFCLVLLASVLYRPTSLNMNAVTDLFEIRQRNISQSEPVNNSVFERAIKDSESTDHPEPKKSEPVVESVDSAVSEPPAESSVAKSALHLEAYLKATDRRLSRRSAVETALDLWNTRSEIPTNLDRIDDDLEYFRRVAEKNGLLIRRIEGSFNAVKKLNLPVMLAFGLPGSRSPVYLALIKIEDGEITLSGGKADHLTAIEPTELESHWSGTAYIPWKNFLSLQGTIPFDAQKDSIITLKMLLRDIGFKQVEINPFYDDKTRQAVKEVQIKYGLNVDGAVGSTTKIALYNEKYFSELPHLTDVSNSMGR